MERSEHLLRPCYIFCPFLRQAIQCVVVASSCPLTDEDAEAQRSDGLAQSNTAKKLTPAEVHLLPKLPKWGWVG